ncbi:MAG: hypothetical protein C0403_03485 [Desulfobacterium sp.]|nr:hypothetical protein [Desulfobacterium sp.]
MFLKKKFMPNFWTMAIALIAITCCSPDTSYAAEIHKLCDGDGNIEKIMKLIKEGADINQLDENGMAPLHYASKHGYPICELLLKNGANPNIRREKDNRGETPLHSAARKCYWKNATLLLLRGADVNAKSEDLATPLLVSLTSNVLRGAKDFSTLKQIAEVLLKNGADINVKDRTGNTPLNTAIYLYDKDRESYDSALAEFFYKSGAVPDMESLIGMGRLDLLKQSMKENKIDDQRRSPLYVAILFERVEIVEYLISIGLDPKKPIARNWLPLNIAVARNKSPKIAEYFLDHGADINAISFSPNQSFPTSSAPIHIAVVADNANMAKMLINRGADLNRKDDYARTPLHKAFSIGRFAMAELLLEKKVNEKIKDHEGQTAFDMAVASGHEEEAISLLKKYGYPSPYNYKINYEAKLELFMKAMSDIVEQKDKKDEAIREAEQLLQTYPEIVKIRSSFRDNTAIHSAINYNSFAPSILKSVMKLKPDLTLRNNAQQTPLLCLVDSCGPNKPDTEVLKKMIAGGADLNTKDHAGNSPLHFIARCNQNYFEAAEILLQNGADINARNNDQITPFGSIVRATGYRRNPKMIEFLRKHGGIE